MRSELQIPGYTIGTRMWRYAGRAVYRARLNSEGGDAPELAIETLDTYYPDRKQVAAIRREGAIVEQLQHIDGVRQIHKVLPHGSGNLALITDFYDSTLALLLAESGGKGLPVIQVLTIAQRLVRTLEAIHSKDIVHKALTPQNILYNSRSGVIVLAGFGIASELDQERQTAHLTSQPEGPLAYMSPEQTGRMNRDLDYRSDYYSLGILLFELLTGERPFKANNSLEWVHNHISRIPPAPNEIASHVPAMVSAIVLKLLAKCPEERYQSASGLLHDISRCLDCVSHEEACEPFVLGEKDSVQKFLIPQRLYGRDNELHELLSLFKEATAGHTRFCLVHGYSGVGKSALVNEIDRFQVREHGFLVQSKFDQFKHSEAYAELASTFRSLVQQVLLKPEEQLTLWRQRLTDALAPNGALVIDLVPELELIIGEQPAVAELPPAEAQNRLHLVLTAFLRVFAGEGHPVVLFLDDLQWSDKPTLDLLRRVVTSREQSHLLLIGAFRSNEVGAGHPLRLMLDDLQNHHNIRDIPIGPLDTDSVAQLVADCLHCQPDESRELSNLLFNKARGNPFFTNELLRQLYKQGAIIADHGRWCWQLDYASWAEVSDDVVEFMLENLRQLPPQTQMVLQLAACIGSTFNLQTLSTIYEQSIVDTAAALMPALKLHTVLPLHSDYRLVNQQNMALALNPSYRFQHDRVQQAAYSLIDKAYLAEVHLSIGRLMLKNADGIATNENLIDIVNHLNEGHALIDSADERLQLTELNLRAASRARQATAYTSALDYLGMADSLLPENAWQQHPTLMQALTAETQQCLYLTGQHEAADQRIDIMLEHAESPLHHADILATRTRQYATSGRMEASIFSAIEGLALVGVVITDQPTLQDIANERQHVEVNLAGRAIADLVDAPIVDDPATLTAMRLLMEIFAAAFLSGAGNQFQYLVLKAVNLSLRNGNSPESAFTYAAYGMLLCGELDEPAVGYQYGKVGLAINERLDDLSLRARVIYVYAMFVHHWSNHWSTLTPWFRKGIEAGYQSGDLLYLAYSAQDCVIWDPTLDLETAHQLHQDNLEVVRDCAYQDSLDSGTLFLQLQRNLLGLTHAPNSLSDNSFDAQQCIQGMRSRQFMTGIANHHIYHAEVSVLYGDYDQALAYVRAQDKLIKSAMSLPQLVRFYIVATLTLTTHYPAMNAADQKVTRARLQQDLERMTRWADNCEDNFRHLQLLMSAELAHIDGDENRALSLYENAIDAARASGFLRDEATAYERAARLLIAQGKTRSAEGYLHGAHRLYDRWGAHRKVKLMEQEFPLLRELNGSENTEAGKSLYDLDLASVMKASREISEEMVVERLLKKTIAILLENAGGQWGCMVVRNDGRYSVEAAKHPEQGPPRSHLTDKLPTHSLVPTASGDDIPLPMTLISQVFHHGEAVVLHDATSDGAFVNDPYIVALRPRSVLCVPIQRERFEAALYIENNLASAVFTRARVEIIRLLAAQASVAIENARLYEQLQDYSHTLEEKVAERTARLEQVNEELQGLAERDGLTGVANRRRSDSYLRESWLRLRRESQPLSVVLLDVDHFKRFNDTYGHQMGDDCLIQVASALQSQTCRSTDLLARYGGEEFMLILPNTDQTGAALIAEKVRAAIEALAIEHTQSSIGNTVTISVGAATAIPDSQNTIEKLINAADQALYRAKHDGRNRVCLGDINDNSAD
ncbi:Phytochrome-like protein cph2 [BD1-7 clade bacterium]|uniref:Phytochrome-like protein cph2 n=1 Tax=BD1-7 clade bacterium TaxID=2029982 RepID=A0A5S9PC10_9GAMM|nr:Phytochrome-like protein cph2 [BD1-7 clade bacterium]CAA0101219.1 Phytochrome-like protein cph2 [BD1-7 clade bacterium]